MLERIRFLCCLKVCSADEASFVNALYGADLGAFATARAKGIINCCKVVFNLDSAVSAGLFAFHATDATVGAALSRNSALVVIGAFHNDSRGVVDNLDNALGTSACTDAASDTLSRVDLCHVVNHRDRLLRAYARAIAVAQTRGGAGLVTVIGKTCRNACLGSCVIVFLLDDAANAVASHKSHLFDDLARFNAENSGDLSCGVVASGNAKIIFGSNTVRQRLRIRITAAVAASAAVGTGETVSNG